MSDYLKYILAGTSGINQFLIEALFLGEYNNGNIEYAPADKSDFNSAELMALNVCM